jgi:hypothetical protein
VKNTKISCCQVCGADKKTIKTAGYQACSSCRTIINIIENHPEIIKNLWSEMQDEPILPKPDQTTVKEKMELPEVLDGKRYRTVDRESNKWYLSVSEVDGQPVEVFASTAFDRDHELQSRISNLTTITRLISLILRHIFINESLTLNKCLKQIKRSSRQKNDLPDMLYGVLNRYSDVPQEESRTEKKRTA